VVTPHLRLIIGSTRFIGDDGALGRDSAAREALAALSFGLARPKTCILVS
jgi:hypothetical protein